MTCKLDLKDKEVLAMRVLSRNKLLYFALLLPSIFRGLLWKSLRFPPIVKVMKVRISAGDKQDFSVKASYEALWPFFPPQSSVSPALDTLC